MDSKKANQEQKPIVDQLTDIAALAAGTLAATAVRSVAKRAKKAVAKRVPVSVKRGASNPRNTTAERGVKKAAATKKVAKKTSRQSSKKRAKTRSVAGK